MTGFRFAKSRRGGRLLLVLVALVVAVWTTTAAATVMLYADLAGLVELSDVIVQGKVVDQHTFQDEKTQQVSTITTVEVAKTYYGEVGRTVKFSQWGGEYGGQTRAIPGDAKFEPYEEVIIFLADGKGEYAGMRYLTSLGQSKFTVLRHEGQALVFRNLTDLAFLDQNSNEIEPRPSERYTLEAFVPELEALIAGIKGGKR